MQTSMFCIYPRPPTDDFNDVVATFKAGLPSFLDHFFPFAGRIATDPSSGLPEIHCNNHGAELVVGEADVALAGLDYGTMMASVRRVQQPYDKELLVQLVSFACGGFTVAWCTNHVLVDGSALSFLVDSWSALARSGKGVVASTWVDGGPRPVRPSAALTGPIQSSPAPPPSSSRCRHVLLPPVAFFFFFSTASATPPPPHPRHPKAAGASAPSPRPPPPAGRRPIAARPRPRQPPPAPRRAPSPPPPPSTPPPP